MRNKYSEVLMKLFEIYRRRNVNYYKFITIIRKYNLTELIKLQEQGGEATEELDALFDYYFRLEYITKEQLSEYTAFTEITKERGVTISFLKQELELLNIPTRRYDNMIYIPNELVADVRNKVDYSKYVEFRKKSVKNKKRTRERDDAEVEEKRKERQKKIIDWFNNIENFKPKPKTAQETALFKIGVKPQLIESFQKQTQNYFA